MKKIFAFFVIMFTALMITNITAKAETLEDKISDEYIEYESYHDVLSEDEKLFIGKACAALDEYNLSEAAKAGVIANIFVEDRMLDATISNGGYYFGFFQMSANQWYECTAWYGTDLEAQIQYVFNHHIDELEIYTDYSVEEFICLEDPREAAEVFCVGYERCVGATGDLDGVSSINGTKYQKLEKRQRIAELIYTYLTF